MFCVNCGKEIPDGSKFCKHCGYKQPDIQKQNQNTAEPEQVKMKKGFNKKLLLIPCFLLMLCGLFAMYSFVISPMLDDKTASIDNSQSEKEDKESILKLQSELENQDKSNYSEYDISLINSYKEDIQKALDNNDIEKANTILENWKNFIKSINGSDKVSFAIEQVDVSEYPKVKVYARIEDALTGETEYNLSKGGFYIYESLDGNSFERKDILNAAQLNLSETLNISMVADTSGSMDGLPIIDAKNVMCNFLKSVQVNAGDKISLISFDDEVQVQTTFNNNIQSTQNIINNLSTDGSTALYDALYVAINQTASQDGAKCIIAFTDGADNVSRCTPDIISELASRYNIPIFIIGIGDTVDVSELTSIANQTGGYYTNVHNINDMSSIYDSIFKDQKELYLIEYTTSDKADEKTFRNLNIGYSDKSLSTKCDYKYQPSIYMEANVSMAQMFVNDFIIYDSDKRYLTTADLDRLTPEQLRLARNEIYARKGRMFYSDDLQNYFNSKSWYQPSIEPDDFKDNIMFNSFERANAYFIADYERLKGYIK